MYTDKRNESEKVLSQEVNAASTNPDFIMSPKVDFCFKELMQEAGIRKGFIAALLDVEPESIVQTIVLDTHLERQSETDKLGILDVLVELEDGTRIDLEMQVAYFEFWTERILYYLCRMYTGQLKKGQDYDELKKCIHVSILDFVHFENTPAYIHKIHLREDSDSRLYTELLEIQILELPKLKKSGLVSESIASGQIGNGNLNSSNGSDQLTRWMRFFDGKNRKEFALMAEQDQYIAEAFQKLQELSADDKKRIQYEAREKAIRDYNSQVKSYYNRGVRDGEEQGRKKEHEKMVRLNEMNAEKKLIGKIISKIQDDTDLVTTAKELVEAVDDIQRIYEAVKTCGADCSVEMVYEKLHS